MEFPNRSSYCGSFRGGFWEGEGGVGPAQGDRFAGRFQDNMKHGFGTFRWADGATYEGEYCRDKWSGKGR
jgi:hypothetical protein